MTESGFYLDVASQAIYSVYMLALPVLLISLAVGFLVSIFQAVTSIQEQTLSFVPKIVITGLALIYFGPMMNEKISSFASGIFTNLHHYIR
ncbi:MAG: flagellar biosynthesis protein FliQ [Planctomycetales bacterium]|nr:flagellar biosynthesis protein FliQ [bacterium]UNM07425.1 MAG: flagellar biosynthesis protein FliQ [Planctomycetales bacterium]